MNCVDAMAKALTLKEFSITIKEKDEFASDEPGSSKKSEENAFDKVDKADKIKENKPSASNIFTETFTKLVESRGPLK